MRKIFSIALILASGLAVSSCEDLFIECTGCDSTTPWSHPDSSTCYSSKADCDAATGLNCVLCN